MQIYFTKSFAHFNILSFICPFFICIGMIVLFVKLRILTGKSFRKVRIWAFGWLVHQINASLYEVFKLKNFF